MGFFFGQTGTKVRSEAKFSQSVFIKHMEVTSRPQLETGTFWSDDLF